MSSRRISEQSAFLYSCTFNAQLAHPLSRKPQGIFLILSFVVLLSIRCVVSQGSTWQMERRLLYFYLREAREKYHVHLVAYPHVTGPPIKLEEKKW
jgi:hypothetical protein